MKRITILSGKGGVGKTMLGASLALLLSKEKNIIAVDCDVDAPNLALLLGVKEEDKKEMWLSEKAELIEEKCIHCGKCKNICNFSAINWDEEKNQPIFDKFLCEGCGTCQLICPVGAIELKKVHNADIIIGKSRYGFPVITGQLKPGESGSGKIVDEVKNIAEKKAPNAEIMLIDAAAGTSCPVIASIRDSHYIIPISEPTPSSFYDLKKVLKIVKHFRIPYGIVLNKHNLNKETARTIEDFASENGIDILGKIPYEVKIIKSVVNMKPITEKEEKFKKIFGEIISRIEII